MLRFKHAVLALSVCIFFLSSCDNSENSAEKNNILYFQPSFNDKALTCNRSISLSGKAWHYNQLQFFISEIELKHHQGKWKKSSLLISPYQTDKIALLGEYCNNNKVKNKGNWLLEFDANTALTNTTHIRFTLGLPFAINHLNPLTQESPLNIPAMFWGWQKGHKFLRVEMASNNDNWLFHLGSVGCSAASPLRAPKQECRYPNRYTFELPISKENNNIIFDLGALFNKLTITEQSSCQSSPKINSCQTLFSNLSKQDINSVFQQRTRANYHEK
jgi:uncharacterized repeat protein (TIGR04052 family)